MTISKTMAIVVSLLFAIIIFYPVLIISNSSGGFSEKISIDASSKFEPALLAAMATFLLSVLWFRERLAPTPTSTNESKSKKPSMAAKSPLADAEEVQRDLNSQPLQDAIAVIEVIADSNCISVIDETSTEQEEPPLQMLVDSVEALAVEAKKRHREQHDPFGEKKALAESALKPIYDAVFKLLEAYWYVPRLSVHKSQDCVDIKAGHHHALITYGTEESQYLANHTFLTGSFQIKKLAFASTLETINFILNMIGEHVGSVNASTDLIDRFIYDYSRPMTKLQAEQLWKENYAGKELTVEGNLSNCKQTSKSIEIEASTARPLGKVQLEITIPSTQREIALALNPLDKLLIKGTLPSDRSYLYGNWHLKIENASIEKLTPNP